MPKDISDKLVIGISSRALFDLEEENRVFETEGAEAYNEYQRKHEDDVLRQGSAFHIVKALLGLNSAAGRFVEVIVMSRNSPDMGIRIFRSIEHYGLDIERAAFTSGQPMEPYLHAFGVDLFLSRSEVDVQRATDSGIAAAVLYDPPAIFSSVENQVRIAFDGDAVLFSDESERVFKEHGLQAFLEHEKVRAGDPLPAGPLAAFLKAVSEIQSKAKLAGRSDLFRIALVTARGCPAHERVIRTLRAWGIELDEAFFLGGISKDKVLKAFAPHIFFDDQEVHLDSASKLVPSGRVPYPSDSPMSSVCRKE